MAANDDRMEKHMAKMDTHTWDGPEVLIHTVMVKTCSKCGADESDDFACPDAPNQT